ncbi:MAG: phage holin family protein [Pseudomonadales bacterium]|nr:phage holin family protein [Pseudomonadales bacterium]
MILRLLVNVLGLWVASSLLDGIYAEANGDLVWAAIALALVNALIRPIAILLTLPITLLTLGLFLLFINAAMLNLAAWFVDGFYVAGITDSLMGAIIVSLISWAGSAFISDSGRMERVDVHIDSKRRS